MVLSNGLEVAGMEAGRALWLLAHPGDSEKALQRTLGDELERV